MTKIERAILLLVENGYAVHRVTSQPMAVEQGAHSVKEFCALHNLSRTMFYQMVKDGTAPKVMKMGRRSIITREAAGAWRKQ